MFIGYYLLHIHGWFHTQSWLEKVAEPLGGGQFRAYNATSSAALALRETAVYALYSVAVPACVYHLANGVWTMGITWGVWAIQQAQDRALKVCA